jgi:hypothetical protein
MKAATVQGIAWQAGDGDEKMRRGEEEKRRRGEEEKRRRDIP